MTSEVADIAPRAAEAVERAYSIIFSGNIHLDALVNGYYHGRRTCGATLVAQRSQME